jgi:hypothetical protein
MLAPTYTTKLRPTDPGALIHRSAWKGSSANSVCRILHSSLRRRRGLPTGSAHPCRVTTTSCWEAEGYSRAVPRYQDGAVPRSAARSATLPPEHFGAKGKRAGLERDLRAMLAPLAGYQQGLRASLLKRCPGVLLIVMCGPPVGRWSRSLFSRGDAGAISTPRGLDAEQGRHA